MTRGRRPGRHGAREAILDAARQSFGERGFAASTVRGIAAHAGVDPALVLHYFGSKADLFAAAISFPVLPSETLAKLAETDRDQLGETILRLILGVWDDPDALAVWLGMIRSSASDEAIARTFHDFLTSAILGPIADMLDAPDAAYRVSLVGSQLVGLGFARHVLQLEPLATASPDQLVAALAPTLQRYLTGPVDQ